MFQLQGRVSSIDGRRGALAAVRGPAQWRCCSPTGGSRARPRLDAVRRGADNVGWRDQRFFGNYERIGRSTITGLWDEIPQFYSIDTRRRSRRSAKACWCSTMRAQAAKNLNAAYLPISPQFDLRERRDIGTVRVSATPTTHSTSPAGSRRRSTRGELPWGASFGFSNDNEVALPVRSRTNDMDVGAQWTNSAP